MIELPVCADCKTVQYPPREVCVRCLSGNIVVRAVDAAGTLLARTAIHHSLEPRFAPRLPLAIGTVKLDCGPVAFAFLDADCGEAGARVRLRYTDDAGENRLYAAPLR